MPTTKPRSKPDTVKLSSAKLRGVEPTARLHSGKHGSAKTAAKIHSGKFGTRRFHSVNQYTAKRLTKEMVISTIKAAARKLGHTPTSVELKRLNSITLSQVARRFGTYRGAVCAAGLKPNQGGVRVEAAVLLEDWGKVARKVGRVPSCPEYEEAGGYSRHCFTRGFQTWTEVPAAFSRYVASGGLAGNWTDVLKMIEEGPMPTCGKCGRLADRREAMRLASGAEARKNKGVKAHPETNPETNPEPHPETNPPAMGGEMHQPVAGGEMRQAKEIDPKEITGMTTVLPPPLWGKKRVTAIMLAVFVAEQAPSGLQWVTGAFFPRRVIEDRPLMGAPTQLPGLAHEPVNEMGVLVLFAMLSRQLGFILDSVQAAFPDLLARMEVHPGRWQPVRIEVEYLSSHFRRHGHDASKCDLIVCWHHDWKNCPPNLQVLELSKVVKQLQMDGVIW